MTSIRRSTARRIERQRRLERRRRRAVVTATSALSACAMIVTGAFLTAGATGGESDPQAFGGSGVERAAPADDEAANASPATAEPSPSREAEATPGPGTDEGSANDGPFCSDAVAAAIDTGDPEAVVEAAGGGDAFREGVVSGAADGCIALNHPAWDWVVVNKQRPIEPIDYAPEVVSPDTFSPIGAHLDPAAAAALDAMTRAAGDAGVGDIGLESGYRSYDTQVEAYNSQVASRGVDGADLTSARPGYSEHQLGLAVDLVACDGSVCDSMYDFGESAQGQWIAENAWRYGWIVRYEAHATDTTGYEAEPWHLRFVGVELAAAYHEGGYETYEEFWGLPAAPDYAD